MDWSGQATHHGDHGHPDDFDRCWRLGCFGGFLVGREAARLMLPAATGTIIFTGATASLRGSAGFANLAVPKFGLRALSQSMARELGPKGIHIAHVTRSAPGSAMAWASCARALRPRS